MTFLLILLGLAGNVMTIALVYFTCKRNKIGITEYQSIDDDNTGALLASIFWPIGIWIVFGILFFKMLDSNYEKMEKKRELKERRLATEKREIEKRLEELELELKGRRND